MKRIRNPGFGYLLYVLQPYLVGILLNYPVCLYGTGSGINIIILKYSMVYDWCGNVVHCNELVPFNGFTSVIVCCLMYCIFVLMWCYSCNYFIFFYRYCFPFAVVGIFVSLGCCCCYCAAMYVLVASYESWELFAYMNRRLHTIRCILSTNMYRGYFVNFTMYIANVADPDPHRSALLFEAGSGPHYCEKPDPDTSQNSRASEAQNGAVDAQNGGVEAQNGASGRRFAPLWGAGSGSAL